MQKGWKSFSIARAIDSTRIYFKFPSTINCNLDQFKMPPKRKAASGDNPDAGSPQRSPNQAETQTQSQVHKPKRQIKTEASNFQTLVHCLRNLHMLFLIGNPQIMLTTMTIKTVKLGLKMKAKVRRVARIVTMASSHSTPGMTKANR